MTFRELRRQLSNMSEFLLDAEVFVYLPGGGVASAEYGTDEACGANLITLDLSEASGDLAEEYEGDGVFENQPIFIG